MSIPRDAPLRVTAAVTVTGQFQPKPASDLRGVHEGGKWPDKAAECVFRDDHALRMCQREGVKWLVLNWCACFGWAFSFAPCRLHTTRTATLWQTAYCIRTGAVSPPPSQRPRSRSPLSMGLWGQTAGASGSFRDGLAGTSTMLATSVVNGHYRSRLQPLSSDQGHSETDFAACLPMRQRPSMLARNGSAQRGVGMRPP